MSYLEEDCQHPVPWLDMFGCGCVYCCACKQFTAECDLPAGPECMATEVWRERDAEKEWADD